MESIPSWLQGILFAVIAGLIGTEIFLRITRWLFLGNTPRQKDNAKTIPGWFTGIVERIFFTVLIANNLTGVATSLVTWVAVKLAASWSRPSTPGERIFGLLGSIVSLLFAFIGALVWNGLFR